MIDMSPICTKYFRTDNSSVKNSIACINWIICLEFITFQSCLHKHWCRIDRCTNTRITAISKLSARPLLRLTANSLSNLCKGRADNFDLGDTRVGATIDPIPVFVSARLERDKLKANNPTYIGNGVLHRRVIGPEVFSTDWTHVDHVVLPAGSSTPRTLEGVEEVYYVIKGKGAVALKEEKSTFKADNAFYGSLGETLTISNDGTDDLELLVIGISPSKQKGLSIAKPLTKPKAMVLQMDFIVAKENAEAFEKMYYSVYVPAMTVQQGYVGSKLLRLFPENVSKEIQAEGTTYNYQIQISFDTEENRKKWVASSQHQIAWPAATALAKEYKWRGYDVMGDDDQR